MVDLDGVDMRALVYNKGCRVSYEIPVQNMTPVTESIFGLFLWLFAITLVVATIAAQAGF